MTVPEELSRRIAVAADLCLKPHRHAVVGEMVGEALPAKLGSEPGPPLDDPVDQCLRIQPRRADGERLPELDIELELYRSGDELHLMLSWPEQPALPMLWHGQHPVWMDAETGLRTERPSQGAPLEALARRLRALLSPDR
ncbi:MULTISPECIES: hypothetical protein [Synechococcales]|uniref:hypothetical protein n=1 Tax=Synechococcus sp. CS-1324 TaxID=2847980 RepID=UPI00223B077F|nr:hypothetical protein [Synechococcus sp. CS-1324]